MGERTQSELLAGCIVCFAAYLPVLWGIGPVRFKKRNLA